MNKLQKIVLGTVVIIVCLFVLLAPKYILIPDGRSGYYRRPADWKPTETPLTDWNWVLRLSIPTIIFGAFLIYVLKGK